MKIFLIISLLFGSLAYAQVDDPLTKALEESSNKEPQQLKYVPQEKDTPATMTKGKYEITPSIPEDATQKTTQVEKKSPLKLTKEESELLKSRTRNLKDRPDLVADIEKDKKEFNAVYSPSKARDKTSDGYVLERDSSKVITKYISVYDAINLKICFNAGVQLVLDEDVSTALQTILLDDKIFFDSISFDNNRGAYVRLKQPVPEGMYWESSVRMVRKSDDKTYLINLIALPCPLGGYPYPKVVYIKEKFPALHRNSKVMTPENTIIGLSKGLPRVQKNIIRVRDMVASSGSEWVTFNVEVQFPNRKNKEFDKDMSKYFKFLNNLQIDQVPFKVDYLPIQSEYVTKARGVSTMRFEIKVNIDKNYILNNQYLYMMFLDEAEKHYQYVKIDVVPYFLSLKQRGFEL